MRVRYTPAALKRLAHVLEYIEDHSPQDAQRVQARLQAMIALVAQYPHAGQSAGSRGRRRVVLSPYPYIVIYSVAGDEVVIHTIRRAARRPFVG